ncbi:MAG TPA: PA2779 family protein [Steroidobacteraceae bacterium]|nr:PA2779 family protein [Steroidobacteraceae bacterium]
MHVESFRRACVAVVSLSLVSLGLQAPAFAGVVGTADAVAATQQQDHRSVVQGVLARADVREQMLALGVDPAEVDGRIAALTEAELATLATRLDGAPAGGDALVVVGIVFVVLMILEFTGVIDIFKKA